MIAYSIRRLLQGVGVLIAVSIISFAIFQFTGNPALAVVGQYATQQDIKEARQRLGLDEPLYTQYFIFLRNILHGNFGVSYTRNRPVLDLIVQRIPASLELISVATVMALLLGIPLGILTATKPDFILSKIALVGSIVGISAPTFLIGILLILLFAVNLGWLPPYGRGETLKIIAFWESGLITKSGLLHLILPAFTLAIYQLAMLLRLTRGEVMEILDEDYIRTAWAKGLRDRVVIFKHVLRNSLIPVVTIVGLSFGELLAFSIITESIFQWPGLGRLLLSSIYQNDRPTVVAYIMFASLVILSINILVDLLYAYLDPRVVYD